MHPRPLSRLLCALLVLGTARIGLCQQSMGTGSLRATLDQRASADNSKILPILAIGGMLTVAAWPNDEAVQRRAVDSPVLDMGQADLGDIYGNGLNLFALSVGTWGVGQVTGDDYTKETAGIMLKSLALESGLVFGLKHIAGRTRPDETDRLSFPSGHTAGAFTFATVLSRRYGWKLGTVGYTLATMTAGARLEDNRHYLSDVVAGATIGIAVGRWMTRGKTHSSRQPFVYANGSGVGLVLSF